LKVPRRAVLGGVRSCRLNYLDHISHHTSVEKDLMLALILGKRKERCPCKQWLNDLYGVDRADTAGARAVDMGSQSLCIEGLFVKSPSLIRWVQYVV